MRYQIATAAALAAAGLAGVLLTSGTSQAAPRADLGTKRALCTKVGTGELRDLWLTSDGKCQAGYNFTDRAALGLTGGAGGAQGPKGDRGEKGDSAVWLRKTVVKLSASSPATQTATITGVPAKSSLALETAVPLTNAASAPGSAKVTVTPLAVSSGSTERSFTVTVDGLTEPFELIVQVIGTVA